MFQHIRQLNKLVRLELWELTSVTVTDSPRKVVLRLRHPRCHASKLMDREWILHQDGQNHVPETAGVLQPPFFFLLLLSAKWCENLIRQDIKVLAGCREGAGVLIMHRYVRSKSTLFYCFGAHAPKQLSQLIANHPTFKNIICKNTQYGMWCVYLGNPLGRRCLGWKGWVN